MWEKKRGQAGNAVQYITRNQALKKLQLKLSEFRRLCILKGIHPREPRKKTQGQNKTYYHVKDINYLAHEPLLNKFREAYAYERKIRRARNKQNSALAERLAARRPVHRLDHLVRERYPSFVDALRDLDDPLSLVHLFATLPAEQRHGIPTKAVQTARRLALEWQAWVVRTSALRCAFVSVKGFYFQADVLGQPVTWLVPHALAQVLPTDVDYRVMLTFLDFYSTLLQFVNFKLYHTLGVRYPPVVDPRLEQAATGLAALMQDLARGAGAPIEGSTKAGNPGEGAQVAERASGAAAAEPNAAAAERLGTLEARLAQLHQEVAEADDAADGAVGAAASGEESGDEDAGGIDSGADASEGDDDMGEAGVSPTQRRGGVGAAPPSAGPDLSSGGALLLAPDPPTTVAGGAAAADPDDEAAVCGALFRGLVFFLGREVPRETLLLAIRAFGGTAGWAGEGSPIEESNEAITHQVVDRPTQGHRFLGREYVQPQWVFDSLNWRVLADTRLYAPGLAPPPHLSPFANPEDEAGEDAYVPEYAKALRRLQEAARAVRARTAGALQAGVFLDEADDGGARDASAAPAADAAAAAAERLYAAELAPAGLGKRKAGAAEEEDDEEAMAAVMMPRKARHLYASIQKRRGAKRARAAELERRATALAGPGAS
ncbi:hypothetical protein WJX81_005392 [Elliptochloris bilobata]|uniref:Pescadillo homolog n=1 Tax=Elliptochloris bilobata TaxID=381761 RepID=A0AAW1QLH1_9CHLO